MPTNLPERRSSQRKRHFKSEMESLFATCLLTLVLFAMFASLSSSFGSNGLSNIQSLAAAELRMDGL